MGNLRNIDVKIALAFSIISFAMIEAKAAENWDKRVNWWGWLSYNELEMCPNNLNEPCYRFGKSQDNYACRNISGDFENIAVGMEADGDDNITIKFFSCNANRSDVGVLCIDTGQDGGFEACGFIQASKVPFDAALTSRNERAFVRKPRPAK